QVVTRDDATGDLVVKVVNAQAADARTRIDLGVSLPGRRKSFCHPADHGVRVPWMTAMTLRGTDVCTPVADAEAIQRLVPHATPAVIEEAGHLPGAGQPGRLNTVLLDFLTGQVPVHD
ncbi:alpha/beta fold hydrolase, partial [Streptomyces sp. NPDC005794]|uniref:alpha/beta fold hydrolase n=1 Tax=Streptomyces sp. NPDC005794 TaxID=3364733 RepID=UPI00367F3C06